MKNIDSALHTTGRSMYIDDLPVPEGCLHAAVFPSPIAHGKIKKLDIESARKAPGVIAVFTADDIPGQNQIGGIVQDEPLLAEGEVDFNGQPIAFVVAETREAAYEALRLIAVDIEPLPVVVCPREAAKKGMFIVPPRIFNLGNVDSVWRDAPHIIEGRADCEGQEHLYLETQGAFAVPKEDGAILITSSTQGPTAVQRTTAQVLGIPMHRIEVNVQRLGGGFGGKEDQATPWAVMPALASHILKRPVKLVLNRMEDMRMTGKRHPYSADYKIALSSDLKILGYEATFYQNAGAAADLSPAVLGRSLFHAGGSYYIPNVRATGFCCKTHLPPNTAFRGFGGPQAMYVIEAAICAAAERLKVDAAEIQRRNLLKEGDEFPYGMRVKNSEAVRCFSLCEERFGYKDARARVKAFNDQNAQFKKGLALMPVCFGISFTNTPYNQASALAHVYSDGSVAVSTGAVEMGQGVNTKILQVAAHVLSINPDRIKVESTNTTRAANTSATAASSGADLNGGAAALACRSILSRLLELAAELSGGPAEIKDEEIYSAGKKTGLTWKSLVHEALQRRISLSAQAQYATPGLSYDKSREKGTPFAYHVVGTAMIEATVDCLRGRYEIDSVQVVHDFGQSMNKIVDLGQAEGGIAQGIGWMTMEELMFDPNGKLLSNALSTYKVPDIYSTPKTFEVEFLSDSLNPAGIFNSKAVGEPPFMYGIGAYFALRDAIRAFTSTEKLPIHSPMTPERTLMALYAK